MGRERRLGEKKSGREAGWQKHRKDEVGRRVGMKLLAEWCNCMLPLVEFLPFPRANSADEEESRLGESLMRIQVVRLCVYG